MYLNTTWSNGSAGEKMNYIAKDGEEQTPVYDRTGRPMTDAQKDRFVGKSEDHDYYRKFIISPENGNDLSHDELRRETGRVMHDFAKDREDVDYAYAVHENNDGPNHVHVLATGERDELQMDGEELEETKENARERFEENERYQDQERGYTKKPREQSLTERLRDQSKESMKDRADEFARNWHNQRIEDRIAAMDGSRRLHGQRRANNAEDMRQQSYDQKFGTDHPAEQHHSKNFADMREQAHRESLRDRQRERAEQLRKRREREREQDQEQGEDRDQDRGLGR